MTREQWKSLTLVALFGLCTVLVSQIWSGTALIQAAQVFSAEAKVTERIAKLIYPQSYVFNFGGGSHTAVFSDRYGLWEGIRPGVTAILSEKFSEETLTPEQWNEANRFRSIRINLGVAVDPKTLQKLLGVKDTYAGKLTEVDTLLISVAETDSLYMGSDRLKTYTHLKGTTLPVDTEGLVSLVESGGEPEYQTVDEYFGLMADPAAVPAPTVNAVMVPRVQVEPIRFAVVRSEFTQSGLEEQRQERNRQLADAAFGNQYAFINHLVDVNGAVVYLYGYGEKALRIQPSGALEYQAKPDPNLVNEKTDLYAAMALAVEYIDRLGGVPESLFLTDIQLPAEAKGYRFSFSYRVDGLAVVTSEKNATGGIAKGAAPIEVEVRGQQVLALKRNVAMLQTLTPVTDVWPETISFVDIININYEEILPHNLGAPTDRAAMNAAIQARLQDIRSVRQVYFQNLTGDRLLPAWEIDFSGDVMYFNMYIGDMLGADR